MCDMFKAPEPTKEQIAAEKQQKELTAAAQAQADYAKNLEKQKRTADLIARSSGLYGMRSLISGPSGGTGFLGKK